MSMPANDRRKNPQPMTYDQLQWVVAQTDRAVKKAVRKVLLSAAIGYAILFAGVIAMYHNGQVVSSDEQRAIIDSGNVVAVDGCNRDFNRDQRFISLLERLRTASVEQAKRAGTAPNQNALTFYDGEIALAREALPDCRGSAHILTDDPDEQQPAPDPLYRGSKKDG